MKRLASRWNTYWFSTSPLIDLAVCRLILVGCQMVFLVVEQPTTFAEVRRLSALPQGLFNPLPVLHLFTWPFGWGGRPSVDVLIAVYWATLAMGALAWIGWKTRGSLLAFTAGNLFLQSFLYSFNELHHTEAVMMIALIALALSPAGAMLSIDDLRRRRARAAATLRLTSTGFLQERGTFAGWPLRLVRWIFGLIYLSAAVSKLASAGPDWVNGDTLQYLMRADAVMSNRLLGLWLSQHHGVMVMLSWLTIWFEATFVLAALVPRLALLYVPIGIAFHTGIYLTMQAAFFEYFALYAVFVPWASVFARLGRWRPVRPEHRVAIVYDGLCPLCVRTMTTLAYGDWFRRLEFQDATSDWDAVAGRCPTLSREACLRDMHVVLPDGQVRAGFFAFRALSVRVPLLWPLAPLFWLPGAHRVEPRLYGVVASNRFRRTPCESGVCMGIS